MIVAADSRTWLATIHGADDRDLDVSRRERDANARLIVHAVNSHDSLVSALRRLTDAVDEHVQVLLDDLERGWPDELEFATNEARAALALAEAGSKEEE